MAWEYARITASTVTPFADQLNVLGAEGWEVIALTAADKTVGLNTMVVVAKRECVSPPPPANLTAEWYDDPSGRFDKRFWDGRQWTAYVGMVGPPKGRAIDPPTMLPPTKLG